MKPTKPPTAIGLTIPLGPATIGPKCEHSGGQWIVSWDDQLFAFDPNSQMQKDIWLDAMERKGKGKEALAALRWLCWQCGTIQDP